MLLFYSYADIFLREFWVVIQFPFINSFSCPFQLTGTAECVRNFLLLCARLSIAS